MTNSNEPIYFRDTHPTEYICADDLRGKDHTLTIERIDTNAKRWNNGRREPCIALYFRGKQKGLRVNASIHNTIANQLRYGKDLRQWIGKAITIFPTVDDKIRLEDKSCVRVRPVIPKVEAPAKAQTQPKPIVETDYADPAQVSAEIEKETK